MQSLFIFNAVNFYAPVSCDAEIDKKCIRLHFCVLENLSSRAASIGPAGLEVRFCIKH